jgi:hypothetical protein
MLGVSNDPFEFTFTEGKKSEEKASLGKENILFPFSIFGNVLLEKFELVGLSI